jgi:hypothetical protein
MGGENHFAQRNAALAGAPVLRKAIPQGAQSARSGREQKAIGFNPRARLVEIEWQDVRALAIGSTAKKALRKSESCGIYAL